MSEQQQATDDTLTLMSNVDLYVEIAKGEWGDAQEVTARVEKCTAAVFNSFPDGGVPVELSVRLTNDEEIQQLNHDFRGQDETTNVLSFPVFSTDELKEVYRLAGGGGPPVMLGDIVITHGVVSVEAQDQSKNFHDHLTHLVVHGILHLLGFDHIEDEDADTMEEWEKKILASLNIRDPYRQEG